MAEEKNTGESIETISAATDQQQTMQRLQLQINDADAPMHYSTTVRVWSTAEEFNLDFAGPIRPTGQSGTVQLKVDNRMILNPFAAKRLAIALGQAVAQYEKRYGTLELDERRRRIGGEAPAPEQPATT